MGMPKVRGIGTQTIGKYPIGTTSKDYVFNQSGGLSYAPVDTNKDPVTGRISTRTTTKRSKALRDYADVLAGESSIQQDVQLKEEAKAKQKTAQEILEQKLYGIPVSGTVLTQDPSSLELPSLEQTFITARGMDSSQAGVQIEKLGKQLENKFNAFSEKYGGRELSNEEYAKAQREQVSLRVEQYKYNQQYADYLRRVGKNEAEVEGFLEQREFESYFKGGSGKDRNLILPGQKGYEDPSNIPVIKKGSGVKSPTLKSSDEAKDSQRYKVELSGATEKITDTKNNIVYTSTGKENLYFDDKYDVYKFEDNAFVKASRQEFLGFAKDFAQESASKTLVLGQAPINLAGGSKILAQESAKLLAKSKIISAPKTVAVVEGDKILTTTTFRVKVGKLFPKTYEIVTKGVTTVDDLAKELLTKSKTLPGVKEAKMLVQDTSKKITIGGRDIIVTQKAKTMLGSKVTDLLNQKGALSKIGEQTKFKFKIPNKLQEEIGEILFTKTSGQVYVRPVGLIERVGEKVLPRVNKPFKETVKLIESKVLSAKKTVSSYLDIEQVTSVVQRKISIPKTPKVFSTVTNGKKLYRPGIGPVESKSTDLVKNISKSSNSAKKLLNKGNFSLSGTKGKTVSKQWFSDDSALISPIQKYKTLDVTVKGAKGDVVLSKVKLDKFPTQFVYTEQGSKESLKGFGDGFKKPIIERLKDSSFKLLQEPKKLLQEGQKLLPAPNLPLVPSDAFIEKLLSKAPSIIKNIPKASLKSSGESIAKLELSSGSTTIQKTSSGLTLLLRQSVQPKIKIESGVSKSEVKSVVGEKVEFKSSDRFRQDLRKEYKFDKLNLSKQNVYLPPKVSGIFLPKGGKGISLNLGVDQKRDKLLGESKSVSLESGQRFDKVSKLDFNSKIDQALKQQQAQDFKYKFNQVTQFKPINLVAPKFNVPFRPITPIIPVPPFKFPGFKTRPFSTKLSSGSNKAYDVLVRKKGKFVKVASKLPIARATRLGSIYTDIKSSARTFKLQEAGTTKLKDIKKVDLSRFRTPSKRSSLKGPLTFIEKSKYAISSSAEKREIPGMARLVAKRNTLRQVRL